MGERVLFHWKRLTLKINPAHLSILFVGEERSTVHSQEQLSQGDHPCLWDFAHTLLIYEEAWITSPGPAKFSHILWSYLTQDTTLQPERGLLCQGRHCWTCPFRQFVWILIFTAALRPIFLFPWGLVPTLATKTKTVYNLGTLLFIHWQDKQYLWRRSWSLVVFLLGCSLDLSVLSFPSFHKYLRKPCCGQDTLGHTLLRSQKQSDVNYALTELQMCRRK